MTLTMQHVADEFLAAADAAGLKKVFVLVSQCNDEFVVTMSLPNPVAVGEDDQLLVSCCPYQFDDEKHVRRVATAKAQMFADSIPTIH